MNFWSFENFKNISVEPGSSLGVTGSHISKNQRPWKNVWGTRFLQVGNRFPENKISFLWKNQRGTRFLPCRNRFLCINFQFFKSFQSGTRFLPTGVTNAPGVFMEYMNRIFHPYLDKSWWYSLMTSWSIRKMMKSMHSISELCWNYWRRKNFMWSCPNVNSGRVK